MVNDLTDNRERKICIEYRNVRFTLCNVQDVNNTLQDEIGLESAANDEFM